jgi:hypothetical protein
LPHYRPRLLNLAILWLTLAGLLAFAPAYAAPATPAPEQQPQPQQSSAPQTLNFVNGVAQVQSTAGFNQPQTFLFFGTQGQTIRIQLSSQPAGANFEVTGANNVVYKSFGDPSLDWSFTLPASQNYRITVNSVPAVVFTLVVTLGGGSNQPQRINFAPGQTTAQVNGSAAFGVSPQYVFFANAGQNVRIVLTSAGNVANFSVSGVTDNQIYKSPNDASRDWSFVAPLGQDYLVTVSAPTPVNFSLQIFLQGTQPGGAERINFAPGQSTAVVSGSLAANVPRYYVFSAGASQNVRVLLTSQPPGSANFALNGVSDGIVYKPLSDPAREWNFIAPATQDYLITLFSNVGSNFQLELTIPTPLPPTTAPATLTPLPTLPSGCTSNTIQNGGFETDGFWIFGDDPVPPAYTSTTVRSGLRAVRLGIDPALGSGFQNRKSFSSVRQPFIIPAEASIAQLRWWNFYRTEEAQTDSPGLAEDKQQVILLNPDLSTHTVLRSVRRNNNAWIEELVDLTPFRGKSLILYFNAYNDGNGQRTWQFLDDVVINVCFPAVTPTPVVPTNTPVPPVTLIPIGSPSAIAPTLVLPTVDPTFFAGTPIGQLIDPFLLTPMTGSAVSVAAAVGGEPSVVVLTPGEQAAQAAPAFVQPTPTYTPPLPVATPVPAAASLRLFDRPLNEVLTWSAIMLGALAIIGILVALIWQAARRT